MVAADLITDNVKSRISQDIYKAAIKYGALLRPLGNIIYWMPPLNCEEGVLIELKEISQRAINEVFNK